MSAEGATIQSGLEAALLGSCSSLASANCNSGSSARSLGNFFVRVTGLVLQEPPHPSAVPEPGSLLLLNAGILGNAIVRRRR
ncbi:MAG: PEP-CTERM sorting domain-containing protein [Bryobacterales bacterium]|nr:PEP-CTERM sorting domain-containing protein [Bryobacterales bacterium]